MIVTLDETGRLDRLFLFYFLIVVKRDDWRQDYQQRNDTYGNSQPGGRPGDRQEYERDYRNHRPEYDCATQRIPWPQASCAFSARIIKHEHNFGSYISIRFFLRRVA